MNTIFLISLLLADTREKEPRPPAPRPAPAEVILWPGEKEGHFVACVGLELVEIKDRYGKRHVYTVGPKMSERDLLTILRLKEGQRIIYALDNDGKLGSIRK
jgi:hypothetical protein